MHQLTNQDAAQAHAAIIKYYDEARLAAFAKQPGLFGKNLDLKTRKLALQMAGLLLPVDRSISWATPDEWGQAPLGYRARSAAGMRP